MHTKSNPCVFAGMNEPDNDLVLSIEGEKQAPPTAEVLLSAILHFQMRFSRPGFES